MRSIQQSLCVLSMFCVTVMCAGAQPYPVVRPLRQTFDVPDVKNANISLDIKSVDGSSLYKLQCHSAGYTDDPDFDYSGDFECRLSSIGHRDAYSTLLTEDVHQNRDWESRGRFFAADLRDTCARIPQFGTERKFELRDMSLTLQITDQVFTKDGKLISLRLTVTIGVNTNAQRAIAEVVPIPKTGIPAECKLTEYFVDPMTFTKEN